MIQRKYECEHFITLKGWVDPHSEGYQEYTTQVEVLVSHCEGIMGKVLITHHRREALMFNHTCESVDNSS